MPDAYDTGASTKVQYDGSSAQGARGFFLLAMPSIRKFDAFCGMLLRFLGPVKTAELTMLGYTVPNQAFSAHLQFS